MHQLVPLKIKIGLIIVCAGVISGITSWAGFQPLSLSIVVGVIEAAAAWALINSWDWMAAVPLVPRPRWVQVDLNGKWTGTVSSQFRAGENGAAKIVDFPATLTIRQTWQEVVFSLETTQMRSRSSGCIPSYDPITRVLQFRYLFETEPLISATTINPPQRFGRADARISLSEPDKLTIAYTNERGPGGDMTMRREKTRRGRKLSATLPVTRT
jgi:SMODS-associating 2TM, beta-strand rich effector domain